MVVLVIHVVGAIVALISGFSAFRLKRRTRWHRNAGKVYVLGWIALWSTGIIIGARRPGISPFEVINWIGIFVLARGIWIVRRRHKWGRLWLTKHYDMMLSSMAFLIIASINQILPRIGLVYPLWGFFLLASTPFFVIPRIVRRLDLQYYGTAEPAKVQTAEPAKVQTAVHEL